MHTILDEAAKITSGERQKEYGPPRESFDMIADLWTAYLAGLRGTANLCSNDVAHMMILLKVARNSANYKRDNVVDMAGYARLLEMMEGL